MIMYHLSTIHGLCSLSLFRARLLACPSLTRSHLSPALSLYVVCCTGIDGYFCGMFHVRICHGKSVLTLIAGIEAMPEVF
jgi:hypothetical protein